jgi:hypothetical protein
LEIAPPFPATHCPKLLDARLYYGQVDVPAGTWISVVHRLIDPILEIALRSDKAGRYGVACDQARSDGSQETGSVMVFCKLLVELFQCICKFGSIPAESSNWWATISKIPESRNIWPRALKS